MDHANSIFTAQPLAARVLDLDSAVDASSITFTLADLSSGLSATFSGAGVSYDAASGWAATSPQALVPGHQYRLSVEARDGAGNQASGTQSEGFLVGSATPREAQAQILRTPCTLGPGPTLTTSTATCEHVPISLSASETDLSASIHAGVGEVLHRISLETTVVRIGVDTPPAVSSTPASSSAPSEEVHPAFQAGDPAWAPRSITTRFWLRQPSLGPVTSTAPATQEDIGTLTTIVPAYARSATLEMSPVASAPTPRACADPRASEVTCTPDAVRFFPEVGTPADRYDQRGLYGARATDDGAITFPMWAAPPTQFTSENLQEACSGQPVTVSPLPASVASDPWWEGLRPGGLEVSGCDASGQITPACTFDFVFRHPDGRVAIGLAGHCIAFSAQEWEQARQRTVLGFFKIQDEAAPRIWPFGRPIAWEFDRDDPSQEAPLLLDGTGRDFALVQVEDPQLIQEVLNTTPVLGGPCGQESGNLVPREVEHVGHGQFVEGADAGHVPRRGVVVTDDQWTQQGRLHRSFRWVGAGSFGDSGSPVQVAGAHPAAGISTAGYVVQANVPPPIEADRVVRGPAIAPVIIGMALPVVWDILAAAGETGWVLANSSGCP